jgi:hypothetical protein
MAQHQGTYDAISLQPAQRWTPRGGFITNPRTKLLNTSVASFTASLRANGYAYEVEPLGESPYSIVTTLAVEPDATADTILNDLWELDGNDLEKDYWSAPKIKNDWLGGIDLTQQAAVRALVERWVREGGDQTEFENSVEVIIGGGPVQSISPENKAILDLVVSDLAAGTQSYAIAAYVLRRSVTVPAGTTLAPSFGNANKIFTSAQLVATETTIPLNLRSALPDGYWQKKTPTASQQPDGRWVYRVEYWWAEEYSTMLYETAS